MNKKILITVGILVILGIGAWFFFILIYFQKGPICWPYCPGMTDDDREKIKEQMREAEHHESPIVSQR